MRQYPGEKGLSAGNLSFLDRLSSFYISNGIIIPLQVRVTDISFYQETADFEQMKRNGARGVIIRAGQNLWLDPKFNTFWNDAKGVLPRGTYWYYDSRVEPGRQAELFYGQFRNDFPEMEVVADYEENYGGAYGGAVNLQKFIERLVELGVPRKKIAIYTGYYYWRSNGSTSDYFKQYRLWLAWYTTNPAYVQIPAPWDNNDLLFWQYTSAGDGPAYGVGSKGIDLNYFNGTAAEFDTRYSSAPPPVALDIDVTVIKPEEIESVKIVEGNLRLPDVTGDVKFNLTGFWYDGTNCIPNMYRRIAGREYLAPAAGYSPVACWDSSNNFYVCRYDEMPSGVQYAAELKRFVIIGGKKNPAANENWDNLAAAWNIIASGENKEKYLFTVKEPCTLNQAVDGILAKGYPIVNAGDLDSGRSTKKEYKGDAWQASNDEVANMAIITLRDNNGGSMATHKVVNSNGARIWEKFVSGVLKGDVLGKIPYDTPVDIISDLGKAYKLSWSGVTGFVASGDLVALSVTPPVDPPTGEEYILHVKDGVTRKFVLEQ